MRKKYGRDWVLGINGRLLFLSEGWCGVHRVVEDEGERRHGRVQRKALLDLAVAAAAAVDNFGIGDLMFLE